MRAVASYRETLRQRWLKSVQMPDRKPFASDESNLAVGL